MTEPLANEDHIYAKLTHARDHVFDQQHNDTTTVTITLDFDFQLGAQMLRRIAQFIDTMNPDDYIVQVVEERASTYHIGRTG